MNIDLTLVWAGLLAFAVFAYIVMDGFDLGVGILFPTLKAGDQRDKAMNSIGPVWDGNETWLILGGGGLFAAFPLAYAVLMPAVYTPIIAMLLGLVFRGVAFEYRWRTVRAKPVWDVAFFGGSLLAAFSQGVTLGAILQGVEVSGRVGNRSCQGTPDRGLRCRGLFTRNAPVTRLHAAEPVKGSGDASRPTPVARGGEGHDARGNHCTRAAR